MNKREIILTVMASVKDAVYSPVQIQKLLFLVDKKIPGHVNGPHFNFSPYDYGPFDKEIYQIIDEYEKTGEINVLGCSTSSIRKFRLTSSGQQLGDQLLSTLDPNVQTYLSKLSEFVRSLSFAELVSSIYNEYPEMKRNSVFRES